MPLHCGSSSIRTFYCTMKDLVHHYHVRLVSLILLAFGALLSQSQRVVTAQEPEHAPIYVYDIRALRDVDRGNPNDLQRVWDQTLLISTLQGLVNRDAPRLYLLFVQAFGYETDEFWLETFSKDAPNTSPPVKGWLADRPRQNVNDLDELLTLFADYYDGVVLYDENVPATVNVALTVAGVENLLPVRFDTDPDSLYTLLVANASGRRLPVRARLVAEDGASLFIGKGLVPGTNLQSTGSPKVDAYLWMIENYVKPGKVNATEGGYYLDAFWLKSPNGAVQNHCLTNRDFVVARRGFFFDLSPWEDEAPNDEPTQPLGADFRGFNAIMRAAYDATEGKKIIRVSGFTPWDTKYTDHGACGGKHGGVDTEWRHAEILSNYNGYLDADALGLCAMANASFFQHFPLEERYAQPKPTVDDLRARGLIDEKNRPVDKTFVAVYGGDYDSAAWVYQATPAFWHDPKRGAIVINWAFNPNLADRFAPGFDYFRRTMTPNDHFISGDSGAGYINPMGYVAPRSISKLPDALDVWIEHCKRYFKQWDISGIGFVIDGSAPTTDRATLTRLAAYAPDGITTHRGETIGVVQNPYGGKTGYRPMNFDISTPEQGRDVILGDVRFDRGPQFNTYRTILWSPTKLNQLFELVQADEHRGKRVQFVDAYTFWTLIRLEAEALGVEEFDRRL